MRIYEVFDKSYSDNMTWQDYSTGFYGRFILNDLLFVIDIQFETLEDLKYKYDFEKRYKLSDDIFQDKIIVRVDYSQIFEGEHRFDNVGNAKDLSLKILSTVAIEVGKKLKNEKLNLIYFAAKNHEDESKNVRMSLYPRLGELLKRRLNMELMVDKMESEVLTILVKGFTTEEFFEIREKIYKAEFK